MLPLRKFNNNMKLHFNIEYNTNWGEILTINLRYMRNDNKIRSLKLVMNTDDGTHWNSEANINPQGKQKDVKWFEYTYQLCKDEEILRREWNAVPRKYMAEQNADYVMHDQWRDFPLPYHLYTSAYSVVKKEKNDESHDIVDVPIFGNTIIFRVSAPQLQEGERLALLGNQPALGDWNVSRYLPLQKCGKYEWALSVSADILRFPIEYKYVVIDELNNVLKAWEEGDNRVFDIPRREKNAPGDNLSTPVVNVVYNEALRICESQWKIAGVSVPLFSLRSDNSCGVGDFGDLRRFVDWCAQCGLHVIQLLPLNDTLRTGKWNDSDPYGIVSSFALHPHYADITSIGVIKDDKLMTQFRRQIRELNSLPQYDYEKVHLVKTSYLHKLFAQQGAIDLEDSDCKAFAEDNLDWIEEYSHYCAIHNEEMPIKYYVWLQWHLHKQLLNVSNYARSKGIILKGDLPIGIMRDGIDFLNNQEFFNADRNMGTPPDHDNLVGTNWNFPTYNFKALLGDKGLLWWKRRIKWLEQYFDAIRIDHILAFFRMWTINMDAVWGVLGHFTPSLPLSTDEIAYYGMQFRKEFMTLPFINDTIISRYFGVHAQYVKDNFLIRKKYGMYALRSEVSTQKLVEEHFRGASDEASLWIRDSLMRLIANVLFVEDENNPAMYHPRIHAYNEPVFMALSDEEREAFMRLYNNYYYERHEMLWRNNAQSLLSILFGDTKMLLCAEDLGMLPACVGEVLSQQRILSLEIQTLPKYLGEEFTHLSQNPVRSVCSFSTHDMAPLRLWWQENPSKAQRYYTSVMMREGSAPNAITPQLAEEIIARHIYSPSMLCIMQIQDYMAMDTNPRQNALPLSSERINQPADPYNRWQYRMPYSIETLAQNKVLCTKILNMTKHSKRNA